MLLELGGELVESMTHFYSQIFLLVNLHFSLEGAKWNYMYFIRAYLSFVLVREKVLTNLVFWFSTTCTQFPLSNLNLFGFIKELSLWINTSLCLIATSLLDSVKLEWLILIKMPTHLQFFLYSKIHVKRTCTYLSFTTYYLGLQCWRNKGRTLRLGSSRISSEETCG